MDVIRAFGATLWKMFAADLVLTLGALASIVVLGVLTSARAVPPGDIPLMLAAMVFGVFVTAINLSVVREIRKRSKR